MYFEHPDDTRTRVTNAIDLLGIFLRHETIRDAIRGDLQKNRAADTPPHMLGRLEDDREVLGKGPRANVSSWLEKIFAFAPPIAAEDFIDALYHQIGGRDISDEVWAQSYERSVEFTLKSIIPPRYYKVRHNAEFWCRNDREVGELGVFTRHHRYKAPWPVIWNNAHFNVYLDDGEKVPDWEEGPTDKQRVEVRIDGIASAAGMEQLQSRLRPWMPVLGEIVRTSAVAPERVQVDFERDHPFAAILKKAWDEGVRVRFLAEGSGKDILSICIDAILQPKRTMLQRRLYNSLTFYAQALQLRGENADPARAAVGVMLSFSAIEAVVAENDAVVKQVSTYVPALLTPASDVREDATRAIKNLYEVRSSLVHGSESGASDAICELVQTMTAGAIRALASWIQHCDRAGAADQTDRTFITQLLVCARENQPLVGVPDLAKLLPKNSEVKKLLKE